MARSRFPTIGLKKLPEPTTSPVGAGVDDPAGWADAPAASNHPIATSASLGLFIGHPRTLWPEAVYRDIEVPGNTPRRRCVLFPVPYRTGRVFLIAVGRDEDLAVGDGRCHELREQPHAVGAERSVQGLAAPDVRFEVLRIEREELRPNAALLVGVTVERHQRPQDAGPGLAAIRRN